MILLFFLRKIIQSKKRKGNDSNSLCEISTLCHFSTVIFWGLTRLQGCRDQWKFQDH